MSTDLNETLASITSGMKKTESGLFYNITKEGTGLSPIKGSKVTVHYKGSLIDGSVLYQSNFPPSVNYKLL